MFVRRLLQEYVLSFRNGSSDGLDSKGRELERRLRREIANSNERRRMQSINTGFKTLKATIPHEEGEKMSKVNCKRNVKRTRSRHNVVGTPDAHRPVVYAERIPVRFLGACF